MMTRLNSLSISITIILAILSFGSMLLPSFAQGVGDEAIPPEVSEHEFEWPLPNKDYANTRADMESQIDIRTIKDLNVAWTFEIPGGSTFGAIATNPIISEGLVYIQDLSSNVFAINLDDGTLIWEQRNDFNVFGPNGVAVGWGKVFSTSSNDTITAYNKHNGEELWSTVLRTQGKSEGITIQPLVYNRMVLVSTVPISGIGGGAGFYRGDAAGILYALDEETGEVVWKWSTVDSEDIWGNREVNSGGGAWYPPAIDRESGISFWGTGNPGPWPGTPAFPNGSSRPGPNLYTNSLVAIDHLSGALQWYNQITPHDLFDLDFQISPILTTATMNDAERDIVLGAGKAGKVFAFDRVTGDILWETSVGKHQNDTLQEVPHRTTVTVYPGFFGGVETPMALADGVVYVPIVNSPGTYTPTGFSGGRERPMVEGELVAIDVNTGIILWGKEYENINIGGATVVNRLVFTATDDGTIYAHNRITGVEVWRHEAPQGINGWPAVSGDTIIWPVGIGPKPVLLALRLTAEE